MIINIDTEDRLNKLKEINKCKAELALEKLIDLIKTNQIKELLGIPAERLDMKDLQSKAASLQADISTPSVVSKDYQPVSINKV